MKNFEEITFEDGAEMEPGTFIADWFDEGVRVAIIRGPASFNCYLGIPKSHPLADQSYDDLPINCHGGLTYSGEGVVGSPCEDFYWYGWDYSHAGDVSFYDLKPEMAIFKTEGDIKWTPKMIKEDAWSAIYNFKLLVKLVEGIVKKEKSKYCFSPSVIL